MTIILPALAVAFAAFCIWLTVRLTTRGWRPTRRFWFAALPLLLLGYPLSFGPIIALHHRWPEWNRLPESTAHRAIRIVYHPVRFTILEGPDFLINPYLAYLDLWSDRIDGYRMVRRGEKP
jgi:hypothetical protein